MILKWFASITIKELNDSELRIGLKVSGRFRYYESPSSNKASTCDLSNGR